MSATLRLEYACTSAELAEAQSLNLRQQVGRGSKWRTRIVLSGLLLVMLLELYLRTRQEVSPAYRPYIYLSVFVLFVTIMLWRRRHRKRPSVPNQLEATTTGLLILTANSKVAMPWSTFSDCLESPNLFVLVHRNKTMLMVMPKRAFPDESWQNWFRTLAGNRPNPALQSSADVPATPHSSSPDRILLTFRLGYRDYLDYTLATWRTWGFILFIAAMLVGVSVVSAFNPPPDAVNSGTKVFFMFELPFLFVMAAMIILIGSLHAWRTHAKNLVPHQVILSDETIGFASHDETGNVPWTTYTCYKETRWSFILWNPRGSVSVLLPKRSIASAEDRQRCGALLSRHLRPSRWFFG